ncbi:Ig-like domain-containing protein [Streptomyces sp. NPDC050738]|uniref:Ig-like domain-containing protein n=1 Tax=Streptomyces sp. NPDC050738 TaxID=3154744 RepID=UPI0034406BCB
MALRVVFRPGTAFRGLAALAVPLLALSALVPGAGPQARAAADDGPTMPGAQAASRACDSPTRTLSGGSTDVLTFASGETVLLKSGTYSGGVNAFPQGAVVCVASDATFAPPYMNNAAGALVVKGTATLQYLTVVSGFRLVNEGSVSAQGLTANGTVLIENTRRHTMDLPNALTLNDGSMLHNAGTVKTGSIVVAADATVVNSGTLSGAGSGFALNGTLDNTGTVSINQYLNASTTSVINNRCVITTTQGWANAGKAVNQGRITMGADYLNNSGSIEQSEDGVIAGAEFTNGGTITGYGGYRFTGNTTNFGTFTGDAADEPVRFWDTTNSGGAVFDTTGGTVRNVLRQEVTVDPDTGPAGCHPLVPFLGKSADLYVSKTGPADVATGGRVTYEVAVTNLGPEDARNVVVTDALPAALTGVTASGGGTVSSDGTKVTWNVGTLAADAVRRFTVTGTAASPGVLLDIVSGTSSTIDPDASDNDGSAETARVTTTVTNSVPLNHAPTIDDQSVTTTTGHRHFGAVAATDPDAGQELTYFLPEAVQNGTVGHSTAHGSVELLPSGLYTYTPSGNFTGKDSFETEVCDDGTPVMCARATVTVTVLPIAQDDFLTVSADSANVIDVTLNDLGQVNAPTVLAQPKHGTAVVRDGVVVYTPDPGYTGADSFPYRVCSPNDATVCADATVHLVVIEKPEPPVVGDDRQTIHVDETAAGSVVVTPARNGAVLVRIGRKPLHGTATSTGGGGYTYRPDPGWTGTDTFTLIGCETRTTVLCDTGTVTITVLPRTSPSPSPSPTPAPSHSPSPPAPPAPIGPNGPDGGGGSGLADTGPGDFWILSASAAALTLGTGTLTFLLAARARRRT